MREVPREQVEEAVPVEVAPSRSDAVAARESGRRRHRTSHVRLVAEVAFAVIDQQPVWLEAIVRDVDVKIAIAIEVARGDASGPRHCFLVVQPKALTAFVHEQQRGVGDAAVPIFIAADVEVGKAVVVEIAPTGSAGNRRGQLRQRHLNEGLAPHVAIELHLRPAEQVGKAVVIEVGGHAVASGADLDECLAALVAPDAAAGDEVGVAIVVQVHPARGTGADFEP